MAKKHKCIECVNHSGWAAPCEVSAQNYEYAKSVLCFMKNSFACQEKDLIRKIDHELYCNKFKRVDNYSTAEYQEESRLRSLEKLKADIAEYERKNNITPEPEDIE